MLGCVKRTRGARPRKTHGDQPERRNDPAVAALLTHLELRFPPAMEALMTRVNSTIPIARPITYRFCAWRARLSEADGLAAVARFEQGEDHRRIPPQRLGVKVGQEHRRNYSQASRHHRDPQGLGHRRRRQPAPKLVPSGPRITFASKLSA